MSTRLLGPKRQKALLGLHRTLVWVGLAMLGLHIIAVLLDPVMHFGLLAVLVPFAAPWKTGRDRAGRDRRLAVSLMLAVSFRMRKWIGQKGWRRLHYLSFGAFALALGHALLVGTDLQGLGGPVLALVAAGPVLWLTFYRLLTPRTAPKPVPQPALAAA